jgi:Sulfotransferase family
MQVDCATREFGAEFAARAMTRISVMKTVFLVGCPRSGTTWLQIILGSHPAIATVRETHLFDRYLSNLYAQYDGEAEKGGKDGLRVLFDEAQFDRLCRQFADGVLAEIAATKPGALAVLEKTASQIWSSRLMRRLYPEAFFLHIVRDPRAVAASMLAYAREDWANEGGADVLSAAEAWLSAVTIGHCELAVLGDRLIEVRYEDLIATPDEVLGNILRRLGLDPMRYDPDRFSIETVKRRGAVGTPLDPAWENRRNFFRRGTAEGWMGDLSPAQIAIIDGICADLMAEFGYSVALRE